MAVRFSLISYVWNGGERLTCLSIAYYKPSQLSVVPQNYLALHEFEMLVPVDHKHARRTRETGLAMRILGQAKNGKITCTGFWVDQGTASLEACPVLCVRFISSSFATITFSLMYDCAAPLTQE